MEPTITGCGLIETCKKLKHALITLEQVTTALIASMIQEAAQPPNILMLTASAQIVQHTIEQALTSVHALKTSVAPMTFGHLRDIARPVRDTIGQIAPRQNASTTDHHVLQLNS